MRAIQHQRERENGLIRRIHRIRKNQQRQKKATQNSAKKKRGKIAKKNFKKEIIDEDERKILEKLSTKINIKKKQVKVSKKQDNEDIKTNTTKTSGKGTALNGPYVKLDAKANYRKYQVVNYSAKCDENDERGELDATVNVRKEKISVVELNQKTPWLCTLCHQRPYHYYLGDLYGPYQIDASKDDDKLNEIWMHESCAVWTPNIYMDNNTLCGLDDAVISSLELVCSECKENGASLICSRHACNQKFHYHCAVQSKCKFNEENFTILCNKHAGAM